MSHYLPQLTSPSDCPSNLKEAIDWILRVTGKDGQGGGNGTKDLAGAVEKLLKDVKASSPELGKTFEQIKKALRSGSSNGLIDALGDGLNKFKEGIQNIPHYKSAYNEQSNWDSVFTGDTSVSNDGKAPPKVAAKIFLGCVPMIFYGLSYLYWRCSDKGGWKKMMLNDGDGSALKNFMEATGFDTKKHLNPSKSGADIATVLQNVNSFKTAISVPNSSNSFAKFLTSLQKPSEPTNRPISALSLCAQAYFTHKRSTNSHASSSPPSSIRTMLYWLPGLTITPQFGELLEHFDSLFTDGPMPVAISGSQGPDTLSANDLAGHLVTSCISSVPVLRSIQGRSVSDDPLLHYTYRNSEFAYPSSGSALFNALSKYTYALQFQLYFLYRQCSTGITTCGWWLCKFGRSVQAHEKSHICPLECKNSGNAGCRHDGKTPNQQCKHYENCGSDTSHASPLQAFLTDNLQGFTHSLPDSPTHLDNHTRGSMCHIKMGFKAESLRSSGKGVYIFTALNDFCGHSNTPLRQLSERLQCLTKRTPTTLGDVFGFYLQMIGQLFDNRLTMASFAANILVRLDLSDDFQMFAINRYPTLKDTYEKLVQSRSQQGPSPEPSGLSRSLKILYNDLPFWFQLFMVDDSRDMAASLFDLRQHCHKQEIQGGILQTVHKPADSPSPSSYHQCSQHPADLWSLYYPGCAGSGCGKYLSPLCHSTGSTFAPKFAVTYLSWVLYLGDDMQSGFQEMLEEFKDIDCKALGCNQACSHSGGQHGTSCTCNSVVQCGGVLPLLYRNGFQFMDAKDLKNNVKTCGNFHSQLSNVLAENAPLHNLLLAIDEFMYYVRFRFMSMVSSFWLCSLVILLYFIFYGIDVLHFKSHVRFPSSHTVPPIGLLASGKAPTLTKLTYYMP